MNAEIDPAHERLKLRLRLRGYTLSRFSKAIGVSSSAVISVSRGRRRSRRIEQALADALGVPPASLFPDRYTGGAHEQLKS